MTPRRDVSPFRSLAVSVYLPSAFMSVGQAALLVVLPVSIIERGDGLAAAALAFAMRGLGSMLVSVPAGVAIARWGHKAGMLSGTGMMVLSSATIAAAPSTVTVAAATLIFGAGMGTWLLARLAFITRYVPNYQRGTALSGLAGLQRLGMLLGPLLGGLGVESVGFRGVFLSIAATALLTVAVIWMFAPATGGPDVADDGGGHPSRQTLQPSVPTPSARSLVTLVPRMLRRYRRVFVSAGLFVFSLQLLREQRRLLVVLWGTSIGVGVEQIGLIVSVAAAVDMAMFPAAGYIMDHWGRKVAGVACIGVMAVAMGLLPFTTTVLSYLLVTVMAGFGNGLGSGIILTMGADFAPASETSQFLGVWRMVGDLGALMGPLLTSIAASLVIALGLSSLIGLGGGVVLWICVNETLAKASRSVIGPTGTSA